MMSDASSEQEDDERSHHSSSEEAHDDSDDDSEQSCNKRKLLKVMKKLRHLIRTVGQRETMIHYHGPYHDSWGKRFLFRNSL